MESSCKSASWTRALSAMLVKMSRQVCTVSETAEAVADAGMLLMMKSDDAFACALFLAAFDEEAAAATDRFEFFVRVVVDVDVRIWLAGVLGDEGRCANVGAERIFEFEGSCC